MKLVALMLGGLFALASLTGCGKAMSPLVLTPAARAEGVSVAASLLLPARRVQTLDSTYGAADIDHVVLQVLRGGVVVPGATKVVPKASLASAITLSGLHLASAYQISATAYADAAGTNQISVNASSLSASFTTASLASHVAGDTIDETPLAVGVPLGLGIKTGSTSYTAQSTFTFAGQVALTVHANNSKINHVHVSLYHNGSLVTLASGQTFLTYTPSSIPDTRSVTLTNIKLDGTYQIEVQGYKSSGVTTGSLLTVTFNTNAVGGAYEDRPTLSATSVTI